MEDIGQQAKGISGRMRALDRNNLKAHIEPLRRYTLETAGQPTLLVHMDTLRTEGLSVPERGEADIDLFSALGNGFPNHAIVFFGAPSWLICEGKGTRIGFIPITFARYFSERAETLERALLEEQACKEAEELCKRRANREARLKDWIEALRLLSQVLGERLVKRIPAYVHDLVIVPAPDMQGIPFCALESLARFSITIAPSLRGLVDLHKLWNRPRVAAGPPALIWGPNLADAEDELARIGSLFKSVCGNILLHCTGSTTSIRMC
jgi:hypothetical protein